MLLLIKLNQEFSIQLLEEAKAALALSLFLLAAKKNTIMFVSIGQLGFDSLSYCRSSHHIQGILYKISVLIGYSLLKINLTGKIAKPHNEQ